MKRVFFRQFSALCLAAPLLTIGAVAHSAGQSESRQQQDHSQHAGQGQHLGHSQQAIEVHHPWVRAVPPVAKNSAAYLMIVSRSQMDDTLLEASTSVAETVEIHKVVKMDGMMEMMPAGPVTIAAGSHFELKEGGYHLMLINLKRVPKEGETVELQLSFEHAGKVMVQAPVRRSSSGHHQHDAAMSKHSEHQH